MAMPTVQITQLTYDPSGNFIILLAIGVVILAGAAHVIASVAVKTTETGWTAIWMSLLKPWSILVNHEHY